MAELESVSAGLADILQVDSMALAYAVSRLSGVVSPANAAYSAPEVEFQLKNSGAKALFTVSNSPASVFTRADFVD